MASTALTRRDALRLLGVVGGGLVFTACAPVRLALRLAPAEFTASGDRTEAVLRAFVCTVVPGAPTDDPDLTRAYGDPALPFAPYRACFAADLCRRAADRFPGRAFDGLDAPERTAVVQSGLHADVVTRKLYTGAVLLAQLAVYAGMHHDRGSSLIGFDGWGPPRHGDELTYPDPARFLARAVTADGNPA